MTPMTMAMTTTTVTTSMMVMAASGPVSGMPQGRSHEELQAILSAR
jgi:hypothetical protein